MERQSKVCLNTKVLTIKLSNSTDLDEAQHILDVSKNSITAHPHIAWLHIQFWLIQKHRNWSEKKGEAKEPSK